MIYRIDKEWENEQFLRSVNKEYGFFKEITALEHPGYVMQYKSKSKQEFVDQYSQAFKRKT